MAPRTPAKTSAGLFLPLVSRGQAIGTLEISRTRGAFSEDDVA